MAALNYFSYNGKGRVVDTSGNPANRTLYFYSGTSDKVCVVINNTGRARIDRPTGSTSCAID